jgi:hypothetical protein
LKNSSSSSFAALSLNAGLGQVEEEVGLWFSQALESHHPVLLQGLSTVTISQQLHISFLIMEAAWWSLSYCAHSFHLIVLPQDWAMSHILSNVTSLAWSWKQHMIIIILCALFHLIVLLQDWPVSHSLSNATSLASSWKWHGNYHVVCILFIS